MIMQRKMSATADIIGSPKSKTTALTTTSTRKKSAAEEPPKRKRSIFGFGKKDSKDNNLGASVNIPGSDASQQSPSALTRALGARNASNSSVADYFSSSPPLGNIDDPTAYSASPPKTPSRLGNALRRLSSSTKLAGPPTDVPPVPRRILNVDPGRDKCSVPELNPAKLRRVAFSVDVEIAGRSRYTPPAADEEPAGQQTKQLKEQGEGAALKHPELFKEAKDSAEIDDDADTISAAQAIPDRKGSLYPGAPPRIPSSSSKPTENSAPSLPQIAETLDKSLGPIDDPSVPPALSMTPSNTNSDISSLSRPVSQAGPQFKTRPQDKPTHDPLRIYRRCCQLREAPVLKRITEQLGNPASRSPETPEVVECLNLTKSRLQTQDFMCLGDWLAIVPLKRLLLEDAHVDDERLRIVLCGLLSTKPPELLQRRRGTQSRSRLSDILQNRSPGVIEKLVLRNNPKIGREGWAHISLFLNLNKSIRCLDLSTIQCPTALAPADVTPTPAPNRSNSSIGSNASLTNLETRDMADIFSRALTGRIAGDRLEELTFTGCNLTTAQVGVITKAANQMKLKVLGMAENNLTAEGLQHICDYVRGASCRALDVGGNNLRDKLHILASALSDTGSKCQIWALGLARTSLQPKSTSSLYPALSQLPDLRFLDLSHNQDLCGSQPSTIPCLRRYLPRMPMLKRVHLVNVSMTPGQATTLAEILPECRNLAHVNILKNPELEKLTKDTSTRAQEEMCALFTAFMTAVKLSKTLVCIDIDVPGDQSNEVAKALARQVVTYCLRNMERYAAADAQMVNDAAAILPDVTEFDVRQVNQDLLYHRGEDGQFPEDQILGNNSANEDFVVGGQGLVKALSYCLEAPRYRRLSREISNASSPIDNEAAGQAKAKEVSKMLLDTARSVRARLQPVLARETRHGDETVLMRLRFLDETLSGMIARFEKEYPETRKIGPPVLPDPGETSGYESASNRSRGSSVNSYNYLDQPSTNTSNSQDLEPSEAVLDDFYDAPLAAQMIRPSSRRGSNTSVASRHLENEEAQMHRFGQSFRRHILPPNRQNDHLHGTSVTDPEEPKHLVVLRNKLEALDGEELLKRVNKQGWEATFREFFDDAEKLKRMSQRDSTELRDYFVKQMVARKEGVAPSAQGMKQFLSQNPGFAQVAASTDDGFVPRSV